MSHFLHCRLFVGLLRVANMKVTVSWTKSMLHSRILFFSWKVLIFRWKVGKLHTFENRIRQDRSHQWSTRPGHSPGRQWLSLDFEVLRRMDGRTLCGKIVITTGRDLGRPCGSINVTRNYYFVTLCQRSMGNGYPIPVCH